jgi:hypothetical protein
MLAENGKENGICQIAGQLAFVGGCPVDSIWINKPAADEGGKFCPSNDF